MPRHYHTLRPRPRYSAAAINKKPVALDRDGEAIDISDTHYGQTYIKAVRAIVERADKSTDPTYKGITIGEVHRQLGDNVDRSLTLIALSGCHKRNLIPERFSFRQPPVRVLDPSEFPETLTFGYQPTKYVPTTTLTGHRDR
jgi:hypothetical protein